VAPARVEVHSLRRAVGHGKVLDDDTAANGAG